MFPLTNEQFEKLTHYLEMRIAVAFETPTPDRASQTLQFVAELKEDLRRALVGANVS